MIKRSLFIAVLVLFCFSQVKAGGFFLFTPQKKETKKNVSREDEFKKWLKKYRAKRLMPPKDRVDWFSIRILGTFNGKCMIEYKGVKFLVPKGACDEIQLKRIRVIKDLNR